MTSRDISDARFTESITQPIDHDSTGSPSPTISNHNANENSHYGTGNIININQSSNSIITANVLPNLDAIQAKIATALKERHVPRAVYGAQLGSGCMNGTRVQVLRDIEAWILDPKSPQIFWLTGMAGTGKSAIAWSVCAQTRGNSAMILGGSFFCSRSAGMSSQRNVRCIIPTLVQLMARQSVEFSKALVAELRRDPDILHQQVRAQIEHLLYKPLLALKDSRVPIVFVIDALDECGSSVGGDVSSDYAESHRLVSDMLEALVAFSRLSDKLPVRFLVTSRPETHIRDTPVSDSIFSKVLHLHAVNERQVTADIRLYISAKLTSSQRLRAQFDSNDIDMLVRLCDGLFIVATTALQYTLSAGVDRAKFRFKALLNSDRDGLSTGVAAPLDSMYILILKEAATADEIEAENDLPDLLQILASLLCARMTLSVAALGDLLDIPALHLRASLSHLHAVIHIPDDDREPGLRTLHASFGDFLFDRSPSGFRITASIGHQILARGCLDVMAKRLHFNVSRSHSSYEQNQQTKPDSITLSLGYACLEWTYHLSDVPDVSRLDEKINTIFVPRFLFWLEVLSVLGRVSRATAMLMIATLGVKHAELSRFLRDGITFVASSHEAIERSAPHIYLSALPFAAKDSFIHKTFAPVCTGLISAETIGIGPHGARLVMTLAGHEGAVRSISYSPDGRLLASSSADGTIRIWDTRMGEETISPLRSGDGPVQCVDFAPDGNLLASGTDTGYVCIWNLLSGQRAPRRLCGHSDAVNSVAFAPDGTVIASASKDHSVRLWRAEVGELLAVYGDEMKGEISIAWSPDGTTLAFGFKYRLSGLDRVRTLQLRCIKTGRRLDQLLETCLRPSSLSCISFSPDGDKIAFGTQYDVQLHETQTGRLIASLSTKSKLVISTQFSPDGQSILTAGNCGDLLIWDLQHAGDNTPFTVVASEIAEIHRATFSPDGMYIASASNNGSIRIWSASKSMAAVVQPLSAHKTSPYSAAITPDGAVVVSGSWNGPIYVWDTLTGEQKLSLGNGYVHNGLESVAISVHGQLIATGAWNDDSSVLIWDGQTGEVVRELPLQGDDNLEVALVMAFSSDTRWLAGASKKRLYIWEIASSHTLIGQWTESDDNGPQVVFSSDDRLLATSRGTRLQLWGTDTWNQLLRMQAEFDIVSIAFLATGGYIVSIDYEAARFWDVNTGELTRIVMSHSYTSRPIGISPDGYLVASGLYASHHHLWEAATGALIATLRVSSHSDMLIPAGQCVVSYSRRLDWHFSADMGIHIWDLNLARLRYSVVGGSEDPVAMLVSSTLEDGWLTSPSGELLLWVPGEYREHLQVPPCTMLIDWCRVVVKPGDDGWHRGESWTSCWRADAFNLLLQTR